MFEGVVQVFRKMRGVKLTEAQQGELFFSLRRIREKPKEYQKAARKLCDEVGGDYSAALWEVLTGKRNVTAAAMRHNVSENVIYIRRKRFYEEWYRQNKG